MKAIFAQCVRVALWSGLIGGFLWGLHLWQDSAPLMCLINSLHLAAWLGAPGLICHATLHHEKSV